MARRTKDILKEYFSANATPTGMHFAELIDSVQECIGFEELTIVSGAITRTQINHTVDTEGDASTDDLNTINGGVDGQIIRLMAESTSRVVTVKDGVDNINMTGGDYTLDAYNKILVLIYVDSQSEWMQLA